MKKRINNPVLKGFHPDPSILRVSEDYYIATSTFQWFPGVQIYHSRDMINWELISRPLDDKRLLDMKGVPDSGGVWAPCLSYSDGIYYLVYSIVRSYRYNYYDVDNFVTTSGSITGHWSDPVYLNSSGFDPSLFHDDDGKKYIINMLYNHREKAYAFDGIVLQQYDEKKQCMSGRPVRIFKGSSIGTTEGPHLYKINGMYYLMCAEGGTFYNHAVTIARSKSITGPYEISPFHPLITSKDHPELTLQKCGHGSLVETQTGEWYVAHLCGRPNGNHDRCMLGRETAIQRVRMTEDGWFVLDNESGLPEVSVQAPELPVSHMEDKKIIHKFPGELPAEFQTLRVPLDKKWLAFHKEKQSLILYGKESMESLHIQSLVGRRRENFAFMAETKISFSPENYQQIAGMALYYDTTNYFYLNITWDEKEGRVLSVIENDHGVISNSGVSCQLKDEIAPIYMRMIVDNDELQFYWSYDGENYGKIGDILDAARLSDDYYDERKTGLRFTGTFIVLCCQDLSGQRCPAEFEYFIYNPAGE